MLKFLAALCWVWWVVTGTGSSSDLVPFKDRYRVPSIPQTETTLENAAARPDLSASGSATGHTPDKGVVVGQIHFMSEKSGTEKVCFQLNRFCDPLVFSIEGSKPRIVIDIKKVHSWKGKTRIPVNGLLVEQVRTHFHRHKKTLRIVLDLVPSMDYIVEPLYYKAEGIYCLAVKAR